MSSTQGTWKIAEHRIGMQPIATVSDVQNHPFGTEVRARDIGSGAYGEAEFVYVKGVASGAVGKWAHYLGKAGTTTLAVAGVTGKLGVFVSTLDATTKFGWLQISGRAVGKCLTLFADNGVCYLTATAGSVDDSSVAGDFVIGATGRNGAAVTVGDLAGEFELSRPYTLRRTAATG